MGNTLRKNNQVDLEKKEIAWYKQNYPRLNMQCRAPLPGTLAYPLGNGWVNVIPDDSAEYLKFRKEFDKHFWICEPDVKIGIRHDDTNSGMSQ